LALIWANTNAASYHQLLHTSLIPGTQGDGYSLLHVVNDGLMALFFAMAAKEVWESLLPGGVLSKWKTAATPLMATLGGVVIPAYVYIAECWMTGRWGALGRGWAIPCATDIAFSYLVARIVFGKGHPAIAFLLLLAIADDAAGLLILAVAYPQEALQPQWMLGAVAAVAMGIECPVDFSEQRQAAVGSECSAIKINVDGLTIESLEFRTILFTLCHCGNSEFRVIEAL
jgi:Na+:H+ antiporter, NhaA family